ncbi:MAG: Outer rane lipoprotein [Verrucomicrobiota bacterium]|jgi:TolA-binding protein
MLSNKALLRLAFLLFSLPLAGQQQAGQEIALPPADFAKLDTFESVNLEDADKLFKKPDYQGAYAAYKAFSFEFPKSKALPYVLLRQGRCLHHVDKRNAAIKSYQDVVDYFPDNIPYAAAALFHIGECHGQNGEEEKQTATWARLVKDDAYVTQPNSGTALVHLSGAMEKIGKFDEAAEYQWRTAVAFLKSNPHAAKAARDAVLKHYATRNPNHDKLKEFYIAASGFQGDGRNTDKPEDDLRYWTAVLNVVLTTPSDTRENSAAYWSSKIADKFPENDEIRILATHLSGIHEKDPVAWLARMEKQFASKPATSDRLVLFSSQCKGDPAQRLAFFTKHVTALLPTLKPAELLDLVAKLNHPHSMRDEATLVLRSIRADSLSDAEIQRFALLAASFLSEDDVLRHIARIKDSLLATKTRFDYYLSKSHKNAPFQEKALAEIPELAKSPKYAEGLTWTKASLLRELGRFEEAIDAFRTANRQPDSTFEISNCLVALKQFDQAIKTMAELESVGGQVASQAALRISDIHRFSGDKAKEVAQLRTVLRRYPKTKESAAAHDRLESYGVALVGGEAEAQK